MVSKVFVLVFIGLVAVNVVVGGDPLTCYQCENCETAKNPKVCTKDDFASEGETTSSTVGTTTNNDDDSSSISSTDETITTTEKSTEEQRAEENLTTTSSTTTSSTTTTTTTTKATTAEPTEMAYSCYKVKDDEGNIQRGCTKEVSSCEKLTMLSKKWECLKVCSTEECNAATNMQSLAFSTVIFVAIIKMLLN